MKTKSNFVASAALCRWSFRLTQTIGVLFLLAWLARSWSRLILQHGGDARARQTAENLSSVLPYWSTLLVILFLASALSTLVLLWFTRTLAQTEKRQQAPGAEPLVHDTRPAAEVSDGVIASLP